MPSMSAGWVEMVAAACWEMESPHPARRMESARRGRRLVKWLFLNGLLVLYEIFLVRIANGGEESVPQWG